MKGYVFIKNAMILTVTSLILRTIGIVFRIYLAGVIGSEGIGLYQLVFSVYVLGATFATTGISTAVTRLVADNADKGRKVIQNVMSKAFLITAFVALLSNALIFFGADFIAVRFLDDARAIPALKILSFSFIFMGLSSCIRGYFIARRKTLQPSLSQILEEVVRIAVIMLLLGGKTDLGIAACTAIVLLGDTVSEASSFMLLFIMYLKEQRLIATKNSKIGSIVKTILKIALPISGGRYVQTGLHTAENILVPKQLGLFSSSKEQGLSEFGAIKGMAIPILFFPASLLTAFSTMLVPEISEALSKHDSERVISTTERAVRITLQLSIIAAVVFFISGADIGNIIYHDKNVGYIIRFLSPIIPFMYLESVSTGILKGLDQQMSLFWLNCADSIIRIILILIIVPLFGITSFLCIMVVSNMFTSTLSLVRLIQASKIKIHFFEWILKPFAISALGGVVGFMLTRSIPLLLPRCILCVVITVMPYLYLFLRENRQYIPVKRKPRQAALSEVRS